MRSCSEEIYRRSCEVMPGGVNSPVRAFRALGMSPLIAERGEGDQVVDADGQVYIDYCGSWGASILGHAHPDVVRAAVAQIQLGSTFGIATERELHLAHKITSLIPSMEQIRFVSSGTEATMSAVRLARGFTGRSKIVKFDGCYHGHSDSLLVESKGVTQGTINDTIRLPFNDCDAVRSLQGEIAAIIVEPIAANMGVVLPKPGFLECLSKESKRLGAILIFDEVVTGFRVGLKGAQGLYDCLPDLSCFGKVIGGGFPAAAFGGRREIMNCMAPLGPVYQAGTLSGNPVAMRAGLETIKQLERPGFYDVLFEKTERLTKPIREALAKTDGSLSLNQVGSMFTLFFGPRRVTSKEDLKQLDSQRFAHFFRTLFAQGIYIPPVQQEAWFVSIAHTSDHLDYTAECIVHYIENE